MNIKVFNLMLRINEKKVLVVHKLCESLNAHRMKAYVIQSKSDGKMKVGVSAEN